MQSLVGPIQGLGFNHEGREVLWVLNRDAT